MWTHFFDWPAESLIMSPGDANLICDLGEHLKVGRTACFLMFFAVPAQRELPCNVCCIISLV